MMTWYQIPQSAVDSKEPIQLLKVNGKKICLIYHQDTWYATSSKCPHAGANLAGGWCEKGRLICSFHRHSFDLLNGKGAEGQHNCIDIYHLELRSDGMYIELPQSFLDKAINFFG